MGNSPLLPKSRFGRHYWKMQLPRWSDLCKKYAVGNNESVAESSDLGLRSDLDEWEYFGEETNRRPHFELCSREIFCTGLREWEVGVSLFSNSVAVYLWAEADSPEVSVSATVFVLHPTKSTHAPQQACTHTFKPHHNYGKCCGHLGIEHLESGGWLDSYRQLHLQVEVTDTTPQANTLHDIFPVVSDYLGSGDHDENVACSGAHPSKVYVGKFPDTIVIVEGYRVETHRARLATRSITFESMFASQQPAGTCTCTAVEQSTISLSDVVGISLSGFAYCLENIYQDLNSDAPFAEPKEFVVDVITCADYLHMAAYLGKMLTLLQKYIVDRPLIPALLSRLQLLGLSSGPAYDALSIPCRQFLLSCLSTPHSPILPSVPSSMIVDMLEDKLLFVLQAETLSSWIRKRHKEWTKECLDAVLKAMWTYSRYQVNVIEYILLLEDIGRPITVQTGPVRFLSKEFADHAPKTPQEWERFKLLPKQIQSFVLTAQLESMNEERDEVTKEVGDSSTTPCKRKFNELCEK